MCFCLFRPGCSRIHRTSSWCAFTVAFRRSSDFCRQEQCCHYLGCGVWGLVFCCLARFTFISCSIIKDIFTVYVICSVNLTADTYLQISYDKASFEVSALMHPSTYLNKILFGSNQGSLQLWNIKSKFVLVMDSECTVTSMTFKFVYVQLNHICYWILVWRFEGLISPKHAMQFI